MKYDPSMIPQFITRLEQAKSEQEIQSVCQEIYSAVVERWSNESTRRKPMSEIRKAVRERFPVKLVDAEIEAESPYFYTASGKRRDVEKNILNHRLEHLAIKYLSEEWNVKPEAVEPEFVKPEVVEPEVVEPEFVKPEKPENDAQVVKEESVQMVNANLDILDYVGLGDEEMEVVKQAIGDADLKEWVKQAILRRANSINALRDRLDEDLSMVPSQELMEDKKYRTNPVACRELTIRAVRAIKDFNAQSPEYRWCITNKMISELTGNTAKAIARAVEGMDIDSYNQSMSLQPVHNRLTKAAIGDIKDVVSIKDILGVD